MPTRYSHPPENEHGGVLLGEHLEDVAERVNYIVSNDVRTPSDEPLADVVKTLAHVHDFGKATTYFQNYLLESTEPEFKQCRYHAPLGSFAAYYALAAKGYETETCLAGFVTVAKHHGQLPDIADYVFNRSHRRETISGETKNAAERQQDAVAMQIKDIDDHVPGLANDVFKAATNGNGSWTSFRAQYAKGALFDEIESTVAMSGLGADFDRSSLSDSCYALVLECWGTLVLADKTSAAAAANGGTVSASTYRANQPSLEALDEYVTTLERHASSDPNGSRTERLNYYRSRARREVLKNAKTFAESGGGVATLTLPTGMGKTVSGLSAALAIRNRTGGERIVYALPFTSIIDQVVDELEDIYKTDTTGRLLTAHHHLSETTIDATESDDTNGGDDVADREDRTDGIAGMLGESWRAGLTVTTFVQLFESLAGPANGQSMKLPALKNSVIVLDEPQSLPLNWWKLVPRLVTMLTERYDATVIAMTATQPQLFDERTELVDDPDTYFAATERVAYELDPSVERYIAEQTDPKSYEDATSRLLDVIDSDETALAICNTIDSAKTLTEHVTDAGTEFVNVGEAYAAALETADSVSELSPETVANRVSDAGDRAVLHLSTRLRPVDRLKLIETAKRLTAGETSLVTVSTQLVEAGVDISFDHVFRDLAPVDSIVQAAGRCNRSFERRRGTVTVWWLDAPADQQKTPAEAVYNRGTVLLPVAADVLDSVRKDDGTLSETAVARTAVTRYYERLHEEKNVGKKEYANYVDEARADELADLSLIDQQRAIDIVICRTEGERETVQDIRTAVDEYDFETVNSLMDGLRTKQISIPVYRWDSTEARELADLPPVHAETDVRCIDPSEPQFSDFYDATTGFVVPDSTVERRFL